jgi:putative transposase
MQVNAVFSEREDLLRNESIYYCQKYSGTKLKEIGERFGISDAVVSQASRRLAKKAETDQQLKEMLDRLETALRGVKS